MFNQPTAQKPETVTNKVNNTAIQENVAIYENYKVILDGIINPNAERLTFEIVDQLDPKSKSKGIRFIVDFQKKAIFFEKKINNGQWMAPVAIQMIPNHFSQGAPFNLVVILRKNGFIINVNCNGNQNLNADTQIVFENLHFINITGDYKYWNFSYKNASENSWMVEGLYGQNSGGIMLQDKIGENAQKFAIKLWHQKDDGFYEGILELEVSIEPKYYKLLIGPYNEEQETKVLSHSYNAGSQFEAIFKFNVYAHKTDIWMDNSMIGTVHIDPANVAANIVNFVQIVGDATGQITKLRKTWVNCTYEMSAKMQNNLKIVAKVLPMEFDQMFRIDFFTGWTLHLQLFFLMTDSLTELTIKEKSFDVNDEPIFSNKSSKVSIKKGEIFHLDIYYKSASEFGLSINEEPEIVLNAFHNLAETTYVTIQDANVGEDLIIMEMSMTNCTNIKSS